MSASQKRPAQVEETMRMSLENKVTIVSGGARGIDAAEARALVRWGARVVIGDIP